MYITVKFEVKLSQCIEVESQIIWLSFQISEVNSGIEIV